MDGLLEQLGGWGRFQVMMTASLKAGVMAIGWSMMQMAFAGIIPDWWCLPDPGHYVNTSGIGNLHRGNWSRDNVTYHACQIPESGGQSCSGHVVFDDSITTVVNEWSLVCDLSYVKSLMTSLQMGGVMLGALFGGQAADTFGRRPTVYITGLAHAITSLVAAFSVSWIMFIVMRIFIGVTLGVYLVSFFPYSIELVTEDYRQLVSAVPGWNVGVSLFALMAWLAPNWSYLHIASSVLTIPFLLTWFVVPESARWLATQGRLDEAEAVLKRVARANRCTVPADARRVLRQIEEKEKQAAGEGRRYTYLDVYRGCRIALITLTLSYIWFTQSFSYYGIVFGVGSLSGNLYLNIFLMTVVEIPSNLGTICMANRLGRRVTCIIFFILCALASFGILLVDKTAAEDSRDTAIVVLAMISKLSVAAGWGALTTFTNEQYPTVIRSLGYGACSTTGRLGGTLAPFLVKMDTHADLVRAYIIIGCMMAACAVAILFVKETKGQDLPDSIISIDPPTEKKMAKMECDDAAKRPEQSSVWTIPEEHNHKETTFSESEHGESKCVRL